MSDRKAELERKKAKLAALREEKERRRREKELKEVEEAALRAVHGSSNEADVHQEVNKVLSEVGILPVSDVVDKISSLPPSLLEPSSGPGSLSDARAGAAGLPRKKANLTIANVHAENIAPKEQVIYDKETQTSGNTVPTSSHGLDYYVLTYDAMGGEGDGEDDSFGPHYDTPPVSYKKLLPPGVLHPGMPDVRAVKPAVTTEEAADQAAKDGDGDGKKQLRELSEEEKKMIVLSDDFQKFFDKTARYVERALAEDADIFVDYTGVLEHDGDADDRSGMQLSLNRSFSDDRWSKGRVITSMDWSTQFPELLVASYSSRGGAVDIGGGGTGAGGNDPDGVALVWNTRFKRTTPEYIFHCQSPVMSVAFAKFHPNLIIGGTYSGRIVLWDNRVNKRTPVQRSTLSAAAHTHPVYCLNVVGTQHAHNLVSVSTDGRLCGWGSLDMLAQPPQETLELHQTQRQGKPVAATALAFPKSSPVVAGGGLDAGLTNDNYFLVGSEEGTVYSGCRHGSKTGILESYEGHYGPVTGLDPHPGLNGLLSAGGNAAGGSSPDLSHLFLTSSFDWTVKLWSSKDRRPIYSFEGSNDYVYDVAWSPVHPAVFATVDGTGRLDLWNLNYDTEVPAASVVVDNGAHALNCVSWTQSGQHIVVGDQGGKLWVYDLGDQLAVPRSDEWNQMALTVQELRNSRTEDDYLPSGTGASSSGASSLSSSVGSSMVGSVGAASMTIPGYSGSPGGLATSPHQSMLTPSRQSGPTSLGGSPLSLR